jgi:hypothetical protein
MNDQPIKPHVKRTIIVTTSETWTVTIGRTTADRATAEVEEDQMNCIDQSVEPTLNDRSEDDIDRTE